MSDSPSRRTNPIDALIDRPRRALLTAAAALVAVVAVALITRAALTAATPTLTVPTTTAVPTVAGAQAGGCVPVMDEFLHQWGKGRTTPAPQWRATLEPLTDPQLLDLIGSTNQQEIPTVNSAARGKVYEQAGVCETTYTITPASSGSLHVVATNTTGRWLVTQFEPTR